MTAIQTRKLEKKYKEKTAVNKIDLAIEAGELFALLGVNGAGKTTTIKMLSCLIPPTSGDALLHGDSIVSKPYAVKEKINVSPQETAIAPNLTSVYCTTANIASNEVERLVFVDMEQKKVCKTNDFYQSNHLPQRRVTNELLIKCKVFAYATPKPCTSATEKR